MGQFSKVDILTLTNNVSVDHSFGSDVQRFYIRNIGEARILMFLKIDASNFSSDPIILQEKSLRREFDIETDVIRLLCSTSSQAEILGVFP